jgi:methyl-accepting chemotaxis protein
MRYLGVFKSLPLILAIIALPFSVISAGQAWQPRSTIIAEREHEAREVIESIVHLVKANDDEVKAGHVTLAEAQEAAKKAVRAMRWGNDNEHFSVYRFDGVTLVHPNPKLEGANRLNMMDSHGNHVVSLVIELAKRGTGSITLDSPRKPGLPPAPKIIIAESYAPWEWAIETGFFIDDVDTAIH